MVRKQSLLRAACHTGATPKLHLPGGSDEQSEEASRLAVPHNKVTTSKPSCTPSPFSNHLKRGFVKGLVTVVQNEIELL